jgi:ATP-dependent RNA helicase RhlE
LSFEQFGLDPALVRGVDSLGFSTPTPIQVQAIPVAMQGRDLLAAAMTGSGKTAAFLLPVLQHLLSRPRGVTRALVLTPTRELAAQIHEHMQALAKYTKLTGETVFGGVGHAPQVSALRRGVDIIIATPGRLQEHIDDGVARFDQLEVLVLDEADRMLDMGFLPAVRKVIATLPKKRQTLFFSATMPPEVQRLSKDMLVTPAALNVERKAAPATGVTQRVFPVGQEQKSLLLLELLRRDELGSVIVFTRTKHRANRLSDFLEKRGVPNARIHGNRSQSQRTDALAAFKSGRIRVLCATDIVARGIDVEQLEHVVNFDVPHLPEDYIHRVGRTARAEATGEAFTFVAKDEEGDLAAIEKAIGKKLERVRLADFDYDQKVEKLEVPLQERLAAMRAARKPKAKGLPTPMVDRPKPSGGHRPDGGRNGRNDSSRSGRGEPRRDGRSEAPRARDGADRRDAPRSARPDERRDAPRTERRDAAPARASSWADTDRPAPRSADMVEVAPGIWRRRG